MLVTVSGLPTLALQVHPVAIKDLPLKVVHQVDVPHPPLRGVRVHELERHGICEMRQPSNVLANK